MNAPKKSAVVSVFVFVTAVIVLLVLGLVGNPYPMVSAVTGIVAVICAALGLTALQKQ